MMTTKHKILGAFRQILTFLALALLSALVRTEIRWSKVESGNEAATTKIGDGEFWLDFDKSF
jgi:hypothetical protein